MKIKKADAAGSFYAADAHVLMGEISQLENAAQMQYACESRAVIVPHAALIYSGKLAARAMQHLHRGAKNIFIIAPAHSAAFDGIAVCDYEEFEIPLGTFHVNGTIVSALVDVFGCKVLSEAFSSEHAIEVQLPLLWSRFMGANIVPILVGDVDPKMVEKIVERFWRDRENVFIISSDLGHFHSGEEAEQFDAKTCRMIENCECGEISHERACGATAICGLLSFAEKMQFAPVRIGVYNSGAITGDCERVIGYGAWMLAECMANRFVAENFRERVLSICNRSIECGLDGRNPSAAVDVPEVFSQYMSSFVTLTIGGHLRGCIGSIKAHRPLLSDLISNAHGAAFCDSRFPPLGAKEFKKIAVKVSLLSRPQPIRFSGERELLDAVVPNVDGIIISCGIFQAVYLPCVWEQIPDKNEFLASLKMKAGLPGDFFSECLQAHRFSTECIG
ncbi:MAG: AmmeMemoRadiSam system protein B [Puniceicoccales bacterium]|nr:AmmeMemoRadiSam system protein B [Puniceicoccales bacterium]